MTNTSKTDLLIELADAAIALAERHGFEPNEGLDAWVLHSVPARNMVVFRILDRRTAYFQLEVVLSGSPHRVMMEISGARYVAPFATAVPAAEFLDDLETDIVRAKSYL